MLEMEPRNVLAIIPARGGSKGLPGKNLRELAGRPLIAYAIGAARAAKTVDRVIVSTDDRAIADAAVAAGAEVPFLRPGHLAGDGSDLQDVVIHLLNMLSDREGYTARIHATLLPTFPFLGSDPIDRVVQKCLDGSFSAFTVAPWGRRLEDMFVEEDGRLIPLLESEGDPPPPGSPEDLYSALTAVTAVLTPPPGRWPREDHTSFLAYVEEMKARGTVTTEFQGVVIEDPIRLIDVDTPEDFQVAAKVLEKGLWEAVESVV